MESTEPHQTEKNKTRSDRDKSDLRLPPELPKGQPDEARDNSELDGNTHIRGRNQDIENEVHRRQKQPVSGPSSLHPLETILTVGLKRLLMWGLPLSIAMFVVPAPGPNDGLLV